MNSELLVALRDDLRVADYRPGAISALLGQQADEARLRGVLEPARRALAGTAESALSTLARLFLLGEPVAVSLLERAFPSLGVPGAKRLGLIAPLDTVDAAAPDKTRALVSLNAVEIQGREWLVLSDLDDHLREDPAKPDHVLGVGGATRTLIAQLPSQVSGEVLDLGTGCGIIALHLRAAGARKVVATDVSQRAIDMARMNAVLNGFEDQIDFKLGSLFEPVQGRTFDLIVSNPPFVITPRKKSELPRYDYRDAGFHGDDLIRHIVMQTPEYLGPSATLICLGNWENHWGSSGLTRVQNWIERASQAGEPLAAWIIERDSIDAARYVETWVRDGGARVGSAEFSALANPWLADFEERHVLSVGLGSVRMQRIAAAAATPFGNVIRAERIGSSLGDAAGDALARAMTAGIAAAQMNDQQILGSRWLLNEAVSEIREHRPGEEAPRAITLHIETPMTRDVVADPLLAAAVGACDGDLTLKQISGALATILEVDADACAEALVTSVRELAWLGMLTPADR